MKKLSAIIQRAAVVFGCGICMLYVASCENPYTGKGMFSEISREIKLTEANVKGNIFSIFANDTYVFAGGGGIYYKELGSGRTWQRFPSDGLPSNTQARRLAIGTDSSGETEYLYALRMWTDENDEDKQYASLYYRLSDPASNAKWEEIKIETATDGNIPSTGTLFTNHASESAKRAAYLVTDKGVYKLNGNQLAVVSSGENIGTIDTSTRSAVYVNGKTYFSSSLASCANAGNTMCYAVENGEVKYGDGNGDGLTGSDVKVSDAVSLTFSKKDNCLYAGKGRSGSGAVKIILDESGKPTGTADIGANTDAAIGSYNVYAIFCEQKENTLYASTIGRGSSYSSMYNGLWGLYDPDSDVDAQDKGNWNRE